MEDKNYFKKLKKDELSELVLKQRDTIKILRKQAADIEDRCRSLETQNGELRLYKMESEKWQDGFLKSILECDFLRGQLISKCEKEINAIIDRRVKEKLTLHAIHYYSEPSDEEILYDGEPIKETDTNCSGY